MLEVEIFQGLFEASKTMLIFVGASSVVSLVAYYVVKYAKWGKDF